jgi:phosphatidylinositol alpha-1,6-mannosyltransferase
VTILLLSQVFPPRTGGSGRWLWELYRRLSGLDVHVVAGDVSGAESFDRSASLPITRLPLDFGSWGIMNLRGAAGYARSIPAIRAAVKNCKPDVIHCGKCLPEGLLALAIKRWKGIPFACFVHGEELALSKTTRELSYLTELVLHSATTIVANSVHSMTLLVEQWNVAPENVTVMHPGVDTTRFVPAEANGPARARLAWNDRRVILTVGALQKRKGQDMMIRALPTIRARCPDVLYAIVGQGWEQTYLESLAAEHGVADVVQFRGVTSDDELIELYQQCNLFALPNRQVGWDFEGFGIALIEAQACGKPVIAGASGGAPETLRPHETGEVVNCDEPLALAAAAIALLETPERRAQMGKCAREWVVGRFDWEILVRQARNMFGNC